VTVKRVSTSFQLEELFLLSMLYHHFIGTFHRSVDSIDNRSCSNLTKLQVAMLDFNIHQIITQIIRLD